MKCLNIILLLLICVNVVRAQDTRADVWTPRMNRVVAYIMQESSYSVRIASDEYWQSRYPDAVMVTNIFGISSTRTYNCHGFAWHVSEGGENRWIGKTSFFDEDIYMEDSSYMMVAHEPFPGKISWGLTNQLMTHETNHSGITTSRSGWYMSKWGEGPLMVHQRDDTPYDNTYLRFYIKYPQITGTSTFCSGSSATFSISNFPNNSTITWTPGPNLTKTGTSGNTATFSANGSGSSWIDATIYINSVAYPLARFKISISASPYAYISGPSHVSVDGWGTYATYSANLSTGSRTGINSYTWSAFGTPKYSGHPDDNLFTVFVPASYAGTYALVECKIQHTCNPNLSAGLWVSVISQYPSYVYAYPNPVSNILNVEMDQEAYVDIKASEKKAVDIQTLYKTVTYDIRLYDNMGNMLLRKTSKGEKVEFDVSSLPNGVYFLHIYDGSSEKPEKKQIIIER